MVVTNNEKSCLPSPSCIHHLECSTCMCTKSFGPLGGGGNRVTCCYHDGYDSTFTHIPCRELHTIVPIIAEPLGEVSNCGERSRNVFVCMYIYIYTYIYIYPSQSIIEASIDLHNIGKIL